MEAPSNVYNLYKDLPPEVQYKLFILEKMQEYAEKNNRDFDLFYAEKEEAITIQKRRVLTDDEEEKLRDYLYQEFERYGGFGYCD